MAEGGERLEAVLEGYAKFLRYKDLALPSHQPYLVRWVRQFLRFAREHAGYTFEQALGLFLAEVGGRAGTNPWQVQQAADAVSYLAKVRQWHEADLARGYGEAPLPDALARDELLGHRSVETTMVYTHVVRDLKTKVRSLLDNL
jgi:integrase